MNIQVKIDSACDFLYSSYYIYGFEKLLGSKNVKYSNKEFREFQHNNNFFAVIVYNNNIKKNLIIDFGDSENIDKTAYEWSDLYAKINVKIDEDQSLNKLLSIGPSFGIKNKNLLQTLILIGSNLFKSHNRIRNKKKFIADYINTYLYREKINTYKNDKFQNLIENKIFFSSSIWKKEKLTNDYRKNFIEACLTFEEIQFRGGFAPRNDNNNLEYSNYTDRRYNLDEYIKNIKNSVLVFNTPAVFSCHGWKLAEFCAMGKAIISTPLTRKMPGLFLENEHYLMTDGTVNDIKNKINLILNDKELKVKLQGKSNQYYQEYLEPTKVIKMLINRLFQS